MSRKPVYIFFLILYIVVSAGSIVYGFLQGDIRYTSLSEMINTFYSLF